MSIENTDMSNRFGMNKGLLNSMQMEAVGAILDLLVLVAYREMMRGNGPVVFQDSVA